MITLRNTKNSEFSSRVLPESTSRISKNKHLMTLVAISLMSAVLSSSLQGIAIGFDNNIYQIPIVLRLYDLPQFANDAFIQSLRNYTSWVYPLLGLICTEKNIYPIFVALTLITRAANIFSMLLVADTLGLRGWRVWTLLSAALIVPDTLYARSPIGVDGVFVGWFTHTELAQAFGVIAFCLAIRGRWVMAACCWAITFDLNAFVGVWCSLPLMFLVAEVIWRRRWRAVPQVVLAGVTSVAIIIPNLVWVRSVIRSQSIDFSYRSFLREFFPYHFMIDTASPSMAVLLGVFILSGFLGLWLHDWPRRWMLVYAGLLTVFILGMPLPWLTDSPDLLNLHLLRVDGMVVMLGTTFAVSGIVRMSIVPGDSRASSLMVLTALTGLMLGYRPLAATAAFGGHQSTQAATAGILHAASMALGDDPRIFLAALGVGLAAIATLLYPRRLMWPLAMVLVLAAALSILKSSDSGLTWPHVSILLMLIGCWVRFYASIIVCILEKFSKAYVWATLPMLLLTAIYLVLPFRHGQPANNDNATMLLAAGALVIAAWLFAHSQRSTVLSGCGLALIAVIHGFTCNYSVGAPSKTVGAFPSDEQLMGLRPIAPEWQDVQLWAREHTASDAMFITPIDLAGFETGALRKNWFDSRRGAAVMWSHGYYHEWKQRKQQMASVDSLDVAERYACQNGIDYIVADRRPAVFATQSDPGAARITADTATRLAAVYSNAAFKIFRVGSCQDQAASTGTGDQFGSIEHGQNHQMFTPACPRCSSLESTNAHASLEIGASLEAAGSSRIICWPVASWTSAFGIKFNLDGSSTSDSSIIRKPDENRHSLYCDRLLGPLNLWLRKSEAAMSIAAASASTAASFVSALGVNTHLNYGDTAYANSQNVLNDVAYLGLTRVRDHTPSLDAATLAPYALLAGHGISFDLDAPAGAVDPNAFISQLKGFVAKLPGALIAIEGSNETNLEPVTYNGLTGMPASAALQRALYAAVKADGQLAAIPVYNTTLGGASQAQYSDLGDLSNACDFGNAHIYPSGGPIPNDYIAANIPWETHGTPGKATVITEGGYFTMPGVTSWEGVNQDVQARYTLDYVLDAAAQGVPATYLYELLDERPDPNNTDREQHFGLFNNDGTPKLAATALHNLTSILADPGDHAATGAGLAYTVSNMPAAGHTLELVKASGASDIIVWAEPNIWNQATGTAIAASASKVVVNLGGVMQSVQVFDPLLGTAPIAQLSNVSSVSLAVTDHPLIVEIKPNATPVTPPAADTLALCLSEDAWQGDAQFTISVDGAQVGGTRSVSAMHSGGLSQLVSLNGSWGGGAHSVGITFINDAYGGTTATDRNLFVSSAAFDGTTDAGTSASLYSNGTAGFSVGGGAAVSVACPDRVTLHLSEDAWQGDAQFTLTIDGRPISAPGAVTTLHSSGQMQDFTFAGTFGAGTHKLGVSFVNDAWGGTAATDRNLYIGGIDVNGTQVSGVTAMLANGTHQVSVSTLA